MTSHQGYPQIKRKIQSKKYWQKFVSPKNIQLGKRIFKISSLSYTLSSGALEYLMTLPFTQTRPAKAVTD